MIGLYTILRNGKRTSFVLSEISKLPLGGSQDFPVDLREVYVDWVTRDDTVNLNYSVMVLACLRASMRNYLLQIQMEGHPLIREIMQMDDSVCVLSLLENIIRRWTAISIAAFSAHKLRTREVPST